MEEMDETRVLREWKLIESLLPEGWEALAQKHELLETKYGNAKITKAADLMRLLLVHTVADIPLRQTVAVVAEAGGPDISHVVLSKRLVRAEGYLQELVSRMLGPALDASPETWAGYDVCAVDASTGCRPGSLHGDVRMHTLLRLSEMRYVHVEVTGLKEGESLLRYDLQPGMLVLGDRGYCHAAGIVRSVEKGADVLIRLNRRAIVLKRPDGTVFEPLPWLRRLEGRCADEQHVLIRWTDPRGKAHCINARVCAVRLPAREAEKARQRLRNEQGANVSDESLEAAAYVALITTVPRDRLSAVRCIELYRLRWQVELLFKRWKSLLGFDRIPNYREDAIRAWLYGKVLAAMLLERLASQDGEFPPRSDEVAA
jgi:hypothetical protein